MLGCIREKTIIGHDKDVDVGVLPGTESGPIETAIRNHARMNIDWIDHWEGAPLRIRIRHKNGIGSDIFFYRETDQYFYCGVPRGNLAVLWQDSKFGLTHTEFLGRRYLVPDQPERYLEENYGDWRTPDAWHIAALTSTNLIGGYGELQQATAYLFIADCLYLKDWSRAKHYIDWSIDHGDQSTLLKLAQNYVNA